MPRVILGAVVAALVSVSISGATGVGAARTAPSACKLVTKQEIAAVLGGAQVGTPTPAVNQCSWPVNGGPHPQAQPGEALPKLLGGLVNLQLVRPGETIFETSRLAAGANVQPVDDLGKDAFLITTTGTLWVIEGGSAFSVQGVFPGTDVVADKAALLRVLTRLGTKAARRA
jgi:hypothetical protein